MIDSDAFGGVFEVLLVLPFFPFLLSAPDGEDQLAEVLDDFVELGLLVEGDADAVLLPKQFLVHGVQLPHR